MSYAEQSIPGLPDELLRLENISHFDLAALDDDPALKGITDFASRLCETPIALVSFVERDRQWFPARTGLETRETARESSFCAHTMLRDEVMVIPDAIEDMRFRDNALVVGEPGIRFYAGAPLVSDDGVQLGALCVIDRVPRETLSPLQLEGLTTLARCVVTQLVQRRSHVRASDRIGQEETKFRILADTMPQMVWSARPDGFHDYYNARWYEFTGMPIGSTDGIGWNGMFHPEDQERAWQTWRHSLASGQPYEIEYRLRSASGQYRWTLGRAMPIRDKGGAITRWFGTCTDIHDHKIMQVQREIIAQELSHRIKNIFGVVNGLISFSTRQHPELTSAAADLRERILALGRAHDFVRPHSAASRPQQRPNSLSGMLEELLGAYSGRITVSGEEILIDDHSATPLALAFHELATNAAKYGALTAPDGHVSISCALHDSVVAIGWIERGGPPVCEPTESGFGNRLIELSVVRQLGGTIERLWTAEGLHVCLEIPQAATLRPAKTEPLS